MIGFTAPKRNKLTYLFKFRILDFQQRQYNVKDRKNLYQPVILTAFGNIQARNPSCLFIQKPLKKKEVFQ